MSWTFGRIGLATTAGGDGLTVPAHNPVQWDGDQVTIVTDLYASTVTDQLVLRDQFLGYDLNLDERVVPITSTEDPSMNGFYTVNEVNVDDTSGSHFAGGIGSTATVAARKVRGWQAVRSELICDGTVRTNSHSIAIGSTFPLVGAPVGAFQATPEFATTTTLTGADGAVPVWYQTSPTTYKVTPSWLIAAADAYKGACRLEVSHDSGSTWRTVVGRHPRNLPTYWRISNSLVRVTATTTASKVELSVEHHDGTGWETAKVWQLTADASYTALAYAPTSLACFKNAADEVRVQVGAGTTDRITLDVRLRRGSRVVECAYAHPTVTALGVRRGTNEAADALSTTCGLRATSNDTGGNKYVVCTPSTLAGSDTTIGAIRATTNLFRFGLGIAIGGTVGTGFGETMGVASAYMAGINHRQAAVAV